MDEKLNRKMDEQLASRVAELDAHNDETGDGKLDAADLKAQLNRIEAQLELQDEQNRSIMKNQRLRMLLTIIITVVLLVVLGLFWNHMDQAYKEVMTACTQVNELADTLQSSLDTLDPDELNNMMQDLPAITEQLKQLKYRQLAQKARQIQVQNLFSFLPHSFCPKSADPDRGNSKHKQTSQCFLQHIFLSFLRTFFCACRVCVKRADTNLAIEKFYFSIFIPPHTAASCRTSRPRSQGNYNSSPVS